jgi:alkylation response protein AidB-like acyl-CoA dehydrogenase
MRKNKWFEFIPPKQGSAALEIQEILPGSVKVVSAPTAAFDKIKEVMMWLGAYGYTREAGLERGFEGCYILYCWGRRRPEYYEINNCKGTIGKRI